MGFLDRFKRAGANSDDEIKRYAQRTQALLLARNRDWQQFLRQKLAETEAKITTASKMTPSGLLDDDDFDDDFDGEVPELVDEAPLADTERRDPFSGTDEGMAALGALLPVSTTAPDEAPKVVDHAPDEGDPSWWMVSNDD